MMMNLFSIFDPSSSMMSSLNMNWSSSFLGLIFMPSSFWMIMSRKKILFTKLINKLYKEIKILSGKNKMNSNLLFTSLFIFILFNNFLGLFPYIFTSTSHLTISLSLSLTLWLMNMLVGWGKHTNHMFTHLVPQNTPNSLMPFMVIIESISNMIRPMTLAVRLTANIIAGHLLMTLMSSMGSKITMFMSIMLIFSQMLLLTLEYAVSIIQAYVFMTLITLYSSEVK
uniref:ATP synthase F0 subunit 6 n=1 Tax=Neodiprion huizeensis TaxID=2980995 RepID=UPI0023F40664|nr:ATP synthase F0 subunit 6 [Neodiprion huizeensis]WDY84631.1 ATP synthase F0 subunit 6 [Neodiprion huizeensis]